MERVTEDKKQKEKIQYYQRFQRVTVFKKSWSQLGHTVTNF